ncbi:MAG: c-type cytochrome [Burkholderiaceae bacterium]
MTLPRSPLAALPAWAGLALSLIVSGAAAQTAPPGEPPPRALRALSNDMAERVQACTLCHGAQGRATAQGYFPRLAGKPSGYLFNQLQNFRDGRRQHALMAGLLRNMSDDYLRDIAGYFAALDVPYPSPVPLPLDEAQRRRAEQLVRRGDGATGVPACVSCHGASMAGRQPAVPGLLGLPKDYLVSQLGAWRSGQRRAHAPDCMGQIARTLSPEDVVAVSTWLATQPPGAHAEPPSAQPLPTSCGGLSP